MRGTHTLGVTMENDYNFWADLLTTYRSNPDWLKFLWLFIPAVIMTIAGNGLSRLVQRALAASPPDAASPPEATPSPPPSPSPPPPPPPPSQPLAAAARR